MRQCAGVTEGVEMDYRYGSGPDQVDEFFRTKRSWSKVKDEILGHYIDCYLKTVQHLQRRIIIVDGFAGPGEPIDDDDRSEEHTSELQSHLNLVCRLLLEKK